MLAFGPDIWLSDGPAVTGAAGFQFPTRMAVIRLPEKHGLWIWSPVALTEELRGFIHELGPVRYLIAPNHLHHTFLAEWAEQYPEAEIHAAPGLTEHTTKTAIQFTIGSGSDPAWGAALDYVIVHGNRITTEVVFFHRASATVLVTDLVQQIPKGWFRGWRALVARLDLMSADVPSVPRKFRLAMTDKTAARQAVGHMLEWPCDRLVIAHGPPIETGGQAILRNAFSWLMR